MSPTTEDRETESLNKAMSISTKLAFRTISSRRSLSLMGACLVAILGSVLSMNFERPRAVLGHIRPVGESRAVTPVPQGNPSSIPQKDSQPQSALTPALPAHLAPAVAEPATNLKDLVIPVSGIKANQLHDSFYDSRSEGRMHGALDIMAPHDTPVLAASDGTVLKCHQSDRGGIMLYQSDPSGSYVFYYGHLSRYAEGVAEGKQLKRGDIIAFVGDTGNAGAGNFHLHFGISRMTAPGKWYGGEPINPYPLLRGADEPSIGGK